LNTLILKGKPVSLSIKEKLKLEILNLKSEGIVPQLAAIIVGDNPASKLYVSSKAKTFESLNCSSQIFEFSSSIDQKTLIEHIDSLNKDKKFHGILVQLPLPKHLNEKDILESINPEKDVDGFHPENQGYIMQGNPKFIPCTPLGCLEILKYYEVDIKGKHVVVIGRSNIVGKPIASLLSQNFKYANSTVTLCHSKTEDIASFTSNADVIVAATGVPKLITPDMVKKGVHIIDVGINRVKDLNSKKGYKVVGDVDFEGMLNKAASITPVPGGVGIMTVTMLLNNTVQAAINQKNK
tara:strand:+ start:4019 stop:4903 length:885 start_codon:yes stop_codon:yes gene_type:complete